MPHRQRRRLSRAALRTDAYQLRATLHVSGRRDTAAAWRPPRTTTCGFQSCCFCSASPSTNPPRLVRHRAATRSDPAGQLSPGAGGCGTPGRQLRAPGGHAALPLPVGAPKGQLLGLGPLHTARCCSTQGHRQHQDHPVP